MRRRYAIVLIALVALVAFGIQCAWLASHTARADSTAPSVVRHPVSDPQVQSTNDTFVAAVLARIHGHEKEPASKVFKNIQLPWFKNLVAEDLLSIMNGGYSRALGVTCTHCHDELDFASDDKRPKRAAREMAEMHKMINERLTTMKELAPRPDERSINCMACHRGELDPRGAG
jgi:hypothetical protein